MTEIPRVKLPKTALGNDPDDWKGDPVAVAEATGAVERVAERQRIASGKLSKQDLKKRAAFLELCKEFQARTGHPLCPKDKAQVAQFTIDLKLAGVL